MDKFKERELALTVIVAVCTVVIGLAFWQLLAMFMRFCESIGIRL